MPLHSNSAYLGINSITIRGFSSEHICRDYIAKEFVFSTEGRRSMPLFPPPHIFHHNWVIIAGGKLSPTKRDIYIDTISCHLMLLEKSSFLPFQSSPISKDREYN